MTKVITQEDMLQYAGKEKVVFPSGTILTPLAKDFAIANNISIAIGDSCPNAGDAGSNNTAREKLLRDIVQSVKKYTSESGLHISNDEVEKMVITCIERIGCRVIM